MMTRLVYQVSLAFLIATVASCLLSCGRQEGVPSQMSEEKFLSVYCTLLKNAQNMKNWGQDPRTASKYADSVLAREGVTREDYDETVRWYNADVQRWKTFSEAVIRELERPDTTMQLRPSP
jgi:hypothetical protein